jgi:hypothetical protein
LIPFLLITAPSVNRRSITLGTIFPYKAQYFTPLLTLFMPFWQVLLFLHMIKETKKKGEEFNKQD